MKKFEILEHTADLKIRAFGKTKEELFENAMTGMFTGVRYKGGGKEVKQEVNMTSLDFPSLLVDFLSEVLYLSEVNHQVYYQFQYKTFTDENIKGVLLGKGIENIGIAIKGVTYHGLDIHQREDKIWQATILFDT